MLGRPLFQPIKRLVSIMSNSKIFGETKQSIHNRMQAICDLVDRATVMPHMTQGDISDARAAVNAIEYGEKKFFETLEALHHIDPILAQSMAWAVEHLTGGIAVATNKAALSDSSLNAAAYKQAQDARLARQNSPQEIALAEAIEQALNGRDPIKRGMASQILNSVNQALVAAGHKKVLRDVVSRRLKKPRS